MTITCHIDRFVRLAIAAAAVAGAATTAVSAQQAATYEVVASFENPTRNGAEPAARLLQASDGHFYGTTSAGGRFGRGTIFRITAAGEITLLHDFTGDDGATPVAPLMQASDGNLYGTTFRGGANDFGTIFRFDPAARTLTRLHSFVGAEDGRYPRAGLVQATDGRFYGTTAGVLAWATIPFFGGTVFRMDQGGNVTPLHHFDDFREVHAELIQARDGNLYGVTRGPGITSPATIFRSDLDGNVTTVRTMVGGQHFVGPLRESAAGDLYAVTSQMGPPANQIFLRLDTSSGTFTNITVALASQGSMTLKSAFVQAPDGNFYGTRESFCPPPPDSITLRCEKFTRMSPSGTLTELHTLDVDDRLDSTGLIQAADGNFYGTTIPTSVVLYEKGTVFKYDVAAGPSTLYAFGTDSPGGANPTNGVIQGTDGRLYGTAPAGGAFNRGTVFAVAAAGTVQTLHSFESPYGHSEMGLVQARDGRFYGTTVGEAIEVQGGTLFHVDSAGSFGIVRPVGLPRSLRPPADVPRGALLDGGDDFLYGTLYDGGSEGLGSVFKTGLFGSAVLHSFASDGSDGSHPSAGLLQAPDGTFYGTTSMGSSSLGTRGTVFRVTSEGSLTTLHPFTGHGGGKPLAPVRLGSDGRFYGTTSENGTFGGGAAFAIDTAGNVTSLHEFSGVDGRRPLAGLLQATDGNFYGTTCSGGASYQPDIFAGDGTVFRLSVTGAFATLHSLSGMDGSCPTGELIQATDGHLYGTTRSGGANGTGVLFRVRLATSTPGGYFEIVSRNSGKCLDVFGASTDPAAQVIQWTCHGGANQQWRLEPGGGGAFRIIARHSGQALDVFGALVDDLAPIIQWPVHGGDNQTWTLEPASDGYVRIVARHSGKAADVEFASPDDGARVIQYTPHGGANQQWLLRAVESSGADR